MNRVRFYDPLYGKIEFTEREASLIWTPEVQRLRYVRMCNINSLLVSGASEISRFEHVVGVMHLAKLWTRSNGISGQDAEVIHAAALLHDVQTGPFGHSFEYILEDNRVTDGFQHQDVGLGSKTSFFQLMSANVAFCGARFAARELLGPLWDRVAETIRGDGPFGPIISSRIDLDNIDNVVRLAYHAGAAQSSDADICRTLAGDLRIQSGLTSLSSNGAPSLIRWQQIRRNLYTLLLHDWAEFSAKAMLSSMMELAVAHGLLGADSWRLTDSELLIVLTKNTLGDAQQIGEMARRLMLGNLYEPLLLWKSPNTAAYAHLSDARFKRCIETSIGDRLGTRCLFHAILDRGKTERRVSVLMRDDGEVRNFGHDTNDLLLGVFASRVEHREAARSIASAELRASIEAHGVVDIAELEDPLHQEGSPPPGRQLSLL